MPSGAISVVQIFQAVPEKLSLTIFATVHLAYSADFAGLRNDSDKWLGNYENATNLANETLSSIQVSPLCVESSPQQAIGDSESRPKLTSQQPISSELCRSVT